MPPLWVALFRSPRKRSCRHFWGKAVNCRALELPTGSTILHFVHPNYMPIIDVRTAETLHEAGRIHTKMRDLAHYEEFRFAIDDIRRECPNWTLRQIDKALFAYHKVVLDAKERTVRSARRFHCNRAPSIRESLTHVC